MVPGLLRTPRLVMGVSGELWKQDDRSRGGGARHGRLTSTGAKRHIWRVGEVVLAHRTGIVRVVGAITSSSGANVRAVDVGSIRDHILVNHAA